MSAQADPSKNIFGFPPFAPFDVNAWYTDGWHFRQLYVLYKVNFYPSLIRRPPDDRTSSSSMAEAEKECYELPAFLAEAQMNITISAATTCVCTQHKLLSINLAYAHDDRPQTCPSLCEGTHAVSFRFGKKMPLASKNVPPSAEVSARLFRKRHHTVEGSECASNQLLWQFAPTLPAVTLSIDASRCRAYIVGHLAHVVAAAAENPNRKKWMASFVYLSLRARGSLARVFCVALWHDVRCDRVNGAHKDKAATRRCGRSATRRYTYSPICGWNSCRRGA